MPFDDPIAWGYSGGTPPADPITPELRDSGITNYAANTFITPASVQVGDLIVGHRPSTSGAVPTMGSDFTALADTSAGTYIYDVVIGYRIATAAGVQSHVMGGQNSGFVMYDVWKKDTFDPSDPIDFLAFFLEDYKNVLWPNYPLPGHQVAVGAGWSNLAHVIGLMPGATDLWLNSSGSPYTRGFYSAGGWPETLVGHSLIGSSGQIQTCWNYKINGFE